MSGPRISRGKLEAIRARLSNRDLEILESVATNRFMTSHQIRRHLFWNHVSTSAAIRSTNRALARLAHLQLITHLQRRIGGVRSGSGSNVWSLTEPGARLLSVSGHDGLPARFRSHEPTLTFLEHTLAVSEVALRLSEAARGGDFALVELRREPDCWRVYSGTHGGVSQLKPDLEAVTASGEYEDHWFFEIDRSTEPPSRVVRACLKYEHYRSTGMEQKRTGVFPAVVWVVPDAGRARVLRDRLAATAGLTRGLYAVVVLDELVPLVRAGIEAAGESS